MAPSYEQKTAKIGEIHSTVNLGFKRPVHEGYTSVQGICNTDGQENNVHSKGVHSVVQYLLSLVHAGKLAKPVSASAKEDVNMISQS